MLRQDGLAPSCFFRKENFRRTVESWKGLCYAVYVKLTRTARGRQEERKMRRFVWRILLAVALTAALSMTALAADPADPTNYEEGGIRYNLNTGAVLGPVNKSGITNANIKPVVNGKVITRVEASAFDGCTKLSSVTIPGTVTAIGASAFSNCVALKSAALPEGLTKIEEGTFLNCSLLSSVTIPDTVTQIGKKAFFHTGMERVTFPAGIAAIGESAFEECISLTEVAFQDNVGGTSIDPAVTPTTTIGPKAFYNCTSLKKLSLSGSVQDIQASAFEACTALTKVVIFDGTQTIGDNAFASCTLSDVLIFSKTGSIGKTAFGNVAPSNFHYAGATFPAEALPGDLTADKIHHITSSRSVVPASTCDRTGYVRDTLACDESGCKYIYNEGTRTTPPLPHSLVEKESAKTATCTEKGQLARQGCENCTYMAARIELPALGHYFQATDPTLAENVVITTPPSCTAPGVKSVIYERCDRCNEPGRVDTEEIPATGHTPDSSQTEDHELIPATCAKPGLKVSAPVCSSCNLPIDPTAGCTDCEAYAKLTAPTEQETEAYIAHVKGNHSGEDVATLPHEWNEPALTTTLEPTCTDEGKQEKKQLCKNCAAENPDFASTEGDPIPALGHDWEGGVETTTKEPTCTEPGLKDIAERKCKRDGCNVVEAAQEDVPIDPLGHDWKEIEGTTTIIEATCQEEGLEETGAKECQRCKQHEQGTTIKTPKAPHKWADPIPDESKADENKDPDCGHPGINNVLVKCTVCALEEPQEIEIPPTGQHEWDKWESVKAPTAAEDGEEKRTCLLCKQEQTRILPATGGCVNHEWGEWKTTKEPTATESGLKKRYCKVCNTEESEVIPPNGSGGSTTPDTTSYSIDLIQAVNGSISGPASAKAGATVTLSVRADSGYELDYIRVTSSNGNIVSLTSSRSDRYAFTMPSSRVEVRANFTRIVGSPNVWETSTPSGATSRWTDPSQTTIQGVPRLGASSQIFSDIPTSHWAAGEIAWANQMGYMNGSRYGAFDPDGTITFQQMWMILARLTGSRPTNMADAKRWAVDAGFAEGGNPTYPVTRHQMVTALYRCAHLMGSTNHSMASLAGYADSRTVPTVARDAFSWAVANGIVSGTANGRLNPEATITRAQFAVILYRFSQRV